MKVLVLTTTFPRWKDDATPLFVYEISKRLQESGLKIVVLAPHHEGAKRFEIMNGMRVYRFPYFYPTKYQRLVYEGGILPNLKRSKLAKMQVPLLLLSELYYAMKIVKKDGDEKGKMTTFTNKGGKWVSICPPYSKVLEDRVPSSLF